MSVFIKCFFIFTFCRFKAKCVVLKTLVLRGPAKVPWTLGTLKKRVAEVNLYAMLMIKSELGVLGQTPCF